MLSLKEFKEHLPADHNLTEEEILKLKKNMEEMASLCFDVWLEDRRKKAINKGQS
jgi:hypothetical protein